MEKVHNDHVSKYRLDTIKMQNNHRKALLNSVKCLNWTHIKPHFKLTRNTEKKWRNVCKTWKYIMRKGQDEQRFWLIHFHKTQSTIQNRFSFIMKGLKDCYKAQTTKVLNWPIGRVSITLGLWLQGNTTTLLPYAILVPWPGLILTSILKYIRRIRVHLCEVQCCQYKHAEHEQYFALWEHQSWISVGLLDLR